mgnify:FL=1
MSTPTTKPLIRARDVNVYFDTLSGTVHAVRGIDLDLFAGETLALVGESGAGKSAFAKALLQLNQPPFTPINNRVEGELSLLNPFQIDLIKPSKAELKNVRSRAIGMIFQDSLSALNPVKTVEAQIAEALGQSGRIGQADIAAEVIRMIGAIGLPDPELLAKAYPHQLSGGQCQRVVIAIAAIRYPMALIADEPTTALDVTVQAQILRLLRGLCQSRDMAMLFISHDLGVVAEIADRVAVLRDGLIVEIASKEALFTKPEHDYTKRLIALRPGRRDSPKGLRSWENPDVPPVVEARKISFNYSSGVFKKVRTVKALDGVDLTVFSGETHGILGESGSGKSTLGRVILGFLAPSSGELRTCGREPSRLKTSDRLDFRKEAQVIYQDSLSALNPRMTLGNSAAEGLRMRNVTRPEALKRVTELFEMVGLPQMLMDRFPNEVSGGQRQRVCIARALTLKPKLLIADEPVTALDVSVQSQILDLFKNLKAELDLAMIFISHDIDVIAEVCDNVSVIRKGAIVEQGVTGDVLTKPQSDYTRNLMASMPGKQWL